MKILVWAVFGLLAASWTGLALLVSLLTRWGAQWLASGGASELDKAAPQWPWIPAWMEPAWLQAAQDAFVWIQAALPLSMPLIGSAMQWIVPLVWVLWGLGLVLLLALTGGVHTLVNRYLAPQRHSA